MTVEKRDGRPGRQLRGGRGGAGGKGGGGGAGEGGSGAGGHEESAGGQKVKVVCRVRPFLPHEQPDDALHVEENSVVVNNPRTPDAAEQFSVDRCYGPNTGQATLFEQVWSVIKNCFKGINSTIFCYGVTGSGKTHTIQGTEEDPGIIPRTVKKLFEEKDSQAPYQVGIKFSYLEVYLENVRDLLVKSEKKNTKYDIREDAQKNIYISNLSEKTIHDYDSFKRTFAAACKNRSVASTALNSCSSRSHAVLRIHVTCTDTNTNASRTGKIHLIDLAGSEDNRRTENGKERMAESGAINGSLFALGRVVEALNTGATHIPFRASKMTRLLQDSLGGKSMAMVIANLAPGYPYYAETINTLNFAVKSSQIINKTTVAEFKAPPRPLPKYGLNLKLNKGPHGKPARLASTREEEETNQKAKRPRLGGPTSQKPRICAAPSKADDEEIAKKVEQIVEQKLKEKGIREAMVNDPIHERLSSLEKKLEEQQKDFIATDVSHLLTPETKLKTARVHILEAKKHCNVGDMRSALRHYKKAGILRPDYTKLQTRIKEVEYRIELEEAEDRRSSKRRRSSDQEEENEDESRQSSASGSGRVGLKTGSAKRACVELDRTEVERHVLTVISQGNVSEIRNLHGVGKVSAQKIAEYREHTEINNLDDLMNIGFTKNFINKLIESNMRGT